MKITRKTAMPNVSSHGCGTEFLKQSTNSTIPNLFPFWKPPLQDSCQKGPNSATPLSFCSRILCVFIEITCITKRMPCLRRDKMRPLHLQKYKVPGIKEKGTGLAVCTGHIQCPLAGRKDPDALHPGWAPQTSLRGSSTGWPVTQEVACCGGFRPTEQWFSGPLYILTKSEHPKEVCSHFKVGYIYWYWLQEKLKLRNFPNSRTHI